MSYFRSSFLILHFQFFILNCALRALGGDDGIRTHDPLLAGQVLSQLSYTPILINAECKMHNAELLGFASLLFGIRKEEFIFLSFRSVGIELSSRTVSRKVFSPLQSLTSVFGMGTGGPSAFVTPTSRILDPWKLNNIYSLLSLESPSIVCFCLFSTFKTTQ